MPPSRPAIRLDFSPPIDPIRELIREYAEQLNIDLRFQGFDAELATLPGRYAPPEGLLILAVADDLPAGCGGYRSLGGDVCEMKRLFVRPSFQGLGLGRQIAMSLMEQARQAGYRRMRLDTLPQMLPALALYKSLEFEPIPPYYHNPISGCVYLEANLAGRPH